VSNTVVLYGLIAWIALTHRRFAIGAAAFLSVTVGLGTVYLDTHWFSDVVGGWIAGALVLLVLPSVMPTAQRWTDAAIGWVRTRWAERRDPATALPAALPARRRFQTHMTPVSSAARSQSFTATVSSLDALEDRTRCG
jgi:membrane-associated phospholipid phosphatase